MSGIKLKISQLKADRFFCILGVPHKFMTSFTIVQQRADLLQRTFPYPPLAFSYQNNGLLSLTGYLAGEIKL